MLFNINSYLLIALIAVLPFSTALGSIFSSLILIIWLLRADFKNDWLKIKSNPVIQASLLFLSLHFIGLLWTDDISWGLHVLKKERTFLMIPVFMIFSRKDHINYYIYTFILGMSISGVLSFAIWFKIIPPFLKATTINPSPFLDHISYNPLLAFAIYLLANKLFFEKNYSKWQQLTALFFLTLMSVNMFITGGRSGQIGFFVIIFILAFQTFRQRFIIGLFSSAILCTLIFFTAYSNIMLFQQRVDLAINQVTQYDEKTNKQNSSSARLTWFYNGLSIFSQHPIIGVGTGDLPSEMQKINLAKQQNLPSITNPHNMYIMELIQFGFIGITTLLFLFYSQLKYAISNTNQLLNQLGVALPALFFVINFGESYLSIHATSLLFATFSSFIYRDY